MGELFNDQRELREFKLNISLTKIELSDFG